MLVLLLIPSEKATASRQANDSSLEVGKRYALALPDDQSLVTSSQINSTLLPLQKSKTLQPKQKQTTTELVSNLDESLTWQKEKVRSGDSLGKVFKRLGYSVRTTHDVSSAKGEYSKLLKKINVGDVFHIGKNAQDKLAGLTSPYRKQKRYT